MLATYLSGTCHLRSILVVSICAMKFSVDNVSAGHGSVARLTSSICALSNASGMPVEGRYEHVMRLGTIIGEFMPLVENAGVMIPVLWYCFYKLFDDMPIVLQ